MLRACQVELSSVMKKFWKELIACFPSHNMGCIEIEKKGEKYTGSKVIP
jgi:hypothetical protein